MDEKIAVFYAHHGWVGGPRLKTLCISFAAFERWAATVKLLGKLTKSNHNAIAAAALLPVVS